MTEDNIMNYSMVFFLNLCWLYSEEITFVVLFFAGVPRTAKVPESPKELLAPATSLGSEELGFVLIAVVSGLFQHQIPFKTPRIPSNRYYNAFHRDHNHEALNRV